MLIREQARRVAQARIVKLDGHRPLPASHRVREVQAAVTGEAGQRTTVKEDFAAFGRVRDRGVIPLEVVAVVRRPGRYDVPLETRNRLDDVLACDSAPASTPPV